MKKEYESVDFKTVWFEQEDVITTSNLKKGGDGNELPGEGVNGG